MGNTNANVSAMAAQATTANTTDIAPTIVQPAVQSPIAAEQSEQFEATVMAGLQKLIAGQEEIKSDLWIFQERYNSFSGIYESGNR